MPHQRDHSRRLQGFARKMRREPTDAERKLWQVLRRERIEGFGFRRQFPAGGDIVDFYCLKEKLSVGPDGNQHGDPEHMIYDDRRTKKLGELGIRVIRFDDRLVLREPEVVVENIYRELTTEQSLREPPP